MTLNILLFSSLGRALSHYLVPALAREIAVLEQRVDSDICRLYLAVNELVDSLILLLGLRLVQQLAVVILERSRMGRNDLVHADYLIHSITATPFIVKRFHRLGDLSFLQILDGSIVLRLQLVDLKIRGTGIRVSHLTAIGTSLIVLRIELRRKLESDSLVLDFSLERVERLERLLPVGIRIDRLHENMAGI